MGPIALAGGDEFRPGCTIMDEALLRAGGFDAPTVLVIPTAAAAEGRPDLAADNGVAYFSNLGAKALRLMVVDAEGANVPELGVALDGVTHVYFSGGSPDFLLGVLRGSLLLKKIQKWWREGGVLAGSSAGAMVMGEIMRSPKTGRWIPGLGLCPGLGVLPHHEGRDQAEVAQSLRDVLCQGSDVLGIDAQTGCLLTEGECRVIGAGKVTLYQNSGWRRYSNGESFYR